MPDRCEGCLAEFKKAGPDLDTFCKTGVEAWAVKHDVAILPFQKPGGCAIAAVHHQTASANHGEGVRPL